MDIAEAMKILGLNEDDKLTIMSLSKATLKARSRALTEEECETIAIAENILRQHLKKEKNQEDEQEGMIIDSDPRLKELKAFKPEVKDQAKKIEYLERLNRYSIELDIQNVPASASAIELEVPASDPYSVVVMLPDDVLIDDTLFYYYDGDIIMLTITDKLKDKLL